MLVDTDDVADNLNFMSYAPVSRFSSAQALAQRQRPGIVSLVGLAGIFVAILSLLCSFSGSIFSLAMNAMATRHNNDLKVTVSAPVGAVASPENPHGLSDDAVRQAIEGLSRRMPLSPPRAVQTRVLLGNYGRDILLLGDSVTASSVERMISDCGSMMSTTQFYEIGTGRLEVSDRQAVFRPGDPAATVLRSSDVPNDRSLSEEQIQDVVEAVNAMIPYGDTLEERQQSSLRRLLRDPRQTAITMNGKVPVIFGVSQTTDGLTVIRTATCQIRIDPSGTLTIAPAQAPLQQTAIFPSARTFNRAWPQWALAESLVSVPVAIMLIVACALLLRGRPIGRTMCLWLAIGKIGLTLLAVFVWARFTYEVMNVNNTNPTPTPVYPALGLGLAAVVLWLVYPVLTLLVLLSRSGKAYFKGVM